MDVVIKNICQALKEEAEAIISYTDKIRCTSEVNGAEAVVMQLAKIRLDEVEHIQNLTLELTRLMMADTEPAAESGGEEGYPDRTADIAIGRVAKQEKMAAKKKAGGRKEHGKQRTTQTEKGNKN